MYTSCGDRSILELCMYTSPLYSSAIACVFPKSLEGPFQNTTVDTHREREREHTELICPTHRGDR